MKTLKLNYLLLIIVSAAPFPLFGCMHSSAVTERVDEKLKAEPEVPSGTPTSVATRKVIAESIEVSPKQKSELLRIHESMARDVSVIRGEMAKMQVLLFRNVLDPNADETEIKNIRTRLLGLDRKRTNRILSALDEAQAVIGVKEFKSDRPNSKQPLIDALEPWKMM